MKIVRYIAFVFLFASHCLQAQLIESGYYMFPINPGQQSYLSGNMGELRSNHFHAGLDIKTGGVEGLPVYCSADGYVSRIKVSSYGYGLCLYVTHPNGQSTVYAHLQSFKDVLKKRAIEEQYKAESYEIEIYPQKDEYPVKKGEILGKSGNSGGSGGPHLHWEIRDIYSRPLNILTTNFAEVKDNITPIIYKVGFTTLSADAHMNNEFGFFSLTPSKTGLNTYIIKDVNAIGELGLSLNANDKLNGTSNNNGVAGIQVTVNGTQTFEYFNDKFTFAASKMINQHIEFERYIEGYGHFHRCYLADGNSLEFYKTAKNDGVLRIEAGKTYDVSMKIWDAYNNQTTLTFKINGTQNTPNITPKVSTAQVVKTKAFENILRVSVSNNGKDLIYYKKGQSYTKTPLYIKNDMAIYTFDMRKEVPDSMKKGNIKHAFTIKNVVPPNRAFTSYQKNAIIHFNKGDIKDTVYLDYKSQDDVFHIGSEYTPVYQNISFVIKAQKTYSNKSKTAVYYNNGSSDNFVGGAWDGNDIEFRHNKLGTYKILTDLTNPTIQLLSRNTKTISLKISDNLAGIKSWRATLDGKYLLMGYRYQTGTLASIRLNDATPLSGLFRLEVEDNVGNKKVYTLQL